MAELAAADVETYTGGRLLASDAATAVWLDRALKAVRRYCGWRVTPSAAETLTLDGRGGHRLSLPTMHLTTLTSLTEDGVTLDVTNDLYVSPLGLVRKKSGGCWSSHYGAITVTMTHGYVDAADWQTAVLELVERMSQIPGSVVGNSGPMITKRVDDVQYGWAPISGADPANPLFDMINKGLVNPYRLEPLG